MPREVNFACYQTPSIGSGGYLRLSGEIVDLLESALENRSEFVRMLACLCGPPAAWTDRKTHRGERLQEMGYGVNNRGCGVSPGGAPCGLQIDQELGSITRSRDSRPVPIPGPGPALAPGVLTSHPQGTMSAFQTRQPALTVVAVPEQEQEIGHWQCRTYLSPQLNRSQTTNHSTLPPRPPIRLLGPRRRKRCRLATSSPDPPQRRQ
jgi:hypothetical protein